MRILIAALGLMAGVLGGCGGSNDDPAPPPASAPPQSPAPASPPPVPPYPAGLSDASLQVNGVTRNYRVHVPATVTTAPMATVFVLHGGGGTGLDVADSGTHPLSVFRTVADREGFVVVYPGGLPSSDDVFSWNDCGSDNLVGSTADDIAFLDALIDRIRSQYSLAARAVFMVGSSNGGLMTMSYAYARPAQLAGIGIAIANLPLNPSAGPCSGTPAQAVPALFAHGTADPLMPFAGGCVANFGGACNRGRVISSEATRDRWLQINGLAGVTPVQTTIDIDTQDAGPAQRFDYAGAAPVQWWRLDGAGHSAPSRAVRVNSSPTIGVQNRDVEFAEVAWSFFRMRLP